MTRHGLVRASTALLALAGALVAGAAPAQQVEKAPVDLTKMPPIPDDYTPKTTAWGDPDFGGGWPINDIAEIPVSRPDQYGDRFFKTDAELAKEGARVEQLEEGYKKEATEDKIGLGHWIEYLGGNRRTSMIVDPPSGKLPALTPQAEALNKAGRSSWVNGQAFDWVSDFDTWDRCVSRGFPASMLPFRYNNGIRIQQAPGFVVIDLEMLGTRIIPVVPKARFAELLKTRWPSDVRTWMGQSLAYWDDKNTLVIETTNIVAGDSATGDHLERAAAPLNMATRGVPRNNTVPMSPEAKVVERLTMTGPNTIAYEMTYSDPPVFTAPWTLRVNWTRDDKYEFYEYACFEGDVQVRNFINASRAARGLTTSKVGSPDRSDGGADTVAAK
jgi:hypothetical protein